MNRKNKDQFEKARNDIKKIGIAACCLIALLLVISIFIDPEKSYAADFLISLPEQFTSKISDVQTEGTSAFQTLIQDTATDNHITLPKEFSGLTADGDFISYIYCMDRRLGMSGGKIYTKGDSVKNSVAIAPDQSNITTATSYNGLIYILQNHNRLGGSAEQNYYYTQLAVWWYVDLANGLKDDKNYDKATGLENTTIVETKYADKYATDEYGDSDETEYLFLNNLSVLDKTMLSNNAQGQAIKTLAYEAKEHEKDYPTEKQEQNITIDKDSIKYTMTNEYIETNLIKVTSTNTTFESYSIAVDTSINNYEIVDENNNLLNTTSIDANQTFKVRVPLSEVKDNTFKAKITVVGHFKDWYDANIYNPPTNTSLQRALLGQIEKQTTALSIELEAPKITVPNTGLSANVIYIAGALMVIFGIILIVVAMKPKNENKNK